MLEAGFLNTGDASRLSGYTQQAVKQICRAGGIDFKLVDGIYWVGRTGLEQLIERRRRSALSMREGLHEPQEGA